MSGDGLAAMLRRLEELWAQQGAPILEFLAPGIDGDAVQAEVAPLGITLPDEALTWFSWHNGLLPDAHKTDGGDVIGGNFQRPLSVRQGVEMHQMMSRVAAEWARMEDADPATLWVPPWFPISTGAPGEVVIDTAAPDGPPVHYHDVHHVPWGDWAEPVVASITAMVDMWIEALEHRLWWFVPNEAGGGGWWHRDDPGREARFGSRAMGIV